nr:hypothetical protein [Tanacetum cinerariifolium]
MENNNSFDIINKLKNMFQTQESQELYDTQKQLNACKMEEGQSVSYHILKRKSYIDKLERLGHLMPLVLAVNTVLDSFPKSFDNFVMNYNMHGWDNKSLGELHAMLKITEKNVPSKSVVRSLHMIRDGDVKKKSWKRGKGKCKDRKKVPPPSKKKCVTGTSEKSGLFIIELFAISTNFLVFDIGCDIHICNNVHGMISSRRLEKGAKITGDEIQDILDKKEHIEHAAKNTKLSKPKIIKAVGEVANEAGVKFLRDNDFIKHQDAHLNVLHREHNERLRKKEELKKKIYYNYV